MTPAGRRASIPAPGGNQARRRRRWPSRAPTDLVPPVRALTADDIDGRVYQMVRMRGASTITTVTLDEPTPQMHPSAIAASLRRLLSAARA